jgi:hypothetical protein
MKWLRRWLPELCVFAFIVIADVIGTHILGHDASWFWRWGIAIGAITSLAIMEAGKKCYGSRK